MQPTLHPLPFQPRAQPFQDDFQAQQPRFPLWEQGTLLLELCSQEASYSSRCSYVLTSLPLKPLSLLAQAHPHPSPPFSFPSSRSSSRGGKEQEDLLACILASRCHRKTAFFNALRCAIGGRSKVVELIASPLPSLHSSLSARSRLHHPFHRWSRLNRNSLRYPRSWSDQVLQSSSQTE